jgi:large subunit ribosomal protein L17
MLANMATSLIQHKRITTTIAKAKELRTYVEPLITKAKEDTTHSRRVVFSYLQDKDAVSVLFREVAGKIGDRPGGYTRILKVGNRLGDNADMCIIELVDYNELMLAAKDDSQKKKRRSRRGTVKKTDAPAGEAKPEKAPKAAKASAKAVVEKPVAEAPDVEEISDVAEPEVQDEPKTDEASEEKQA